MLTSATARAESQYRAGEDPLTQPMNSSLLCLLQSFHHECASLAIAADELGAKLAAFASLSEERRHY